MIGTKLTAANSLTAGVVGGGSLLWWLGHHAPALGALAALFGLLVALVFHVLHYIEKRRHNRKMESGNRGTDTDNS